MMIENILDKDMNNLDIKEKVLMEDIIEENVDKISSMEIGLMNNILQKDLENMENIEKTLIEDILMMEVMENINGRKMLAANPTMKLVNVHPNKSPTNTNEVPAVDSLSLNEDPVEVNKAPVRLYEAPEIENAAPLMVSLANPDDSLVTKQDKTQSGKILYCQYCILPANSGGFIIN